MDYLDLFRKFGYSYGPQESYKLDHIAHVVLGERKLSYEEHGNLHTLYKYDHECDEVITNKTIVDTKPQKDNIDCFNEYIRKKDWKFKFFQYSI